MTRVTFSLGERVASIRNSWSESSWLLRDMTMVSMSLRVSSLRLWLSLSNFAYVAVILAFDPELWRSTTTMPFGNTTFHRTGVWLLRQQSYRFLFRRRRGQGIDYRAPLAEHIGAPQQQLYFHHHAWRYSVPRRHIPHTPYSQYIADIVCLMARVVHQGLR